MKNWKENIISDDYTIRQALERLNNLGVSSTVLFVSDIGGKLMGSITDGDIRRGLLNDKSVQDKVVSVMNSHCRRILKSEICNERMTELRNKMINYIPIVNDLGIIQSILDLSDYREFIPADAVIMAGGRGERLLPLTEKTPKPLLKVGNKPIIEHTIDRIARHGIRNIHISVNYLGKQIEDYFGNGEGKELSIRYIREETSLGTIGAVSLTEKFEHDIILLMNSDLLTNIDFYNLYNAFISSGADMIVATVPHTVDMPYAILELDEERVISLQEKPRYTYFANAGIYMIKTDLLNYIPKASFFNATDLMEKVIADGKKLVNYAMLEYWLDIGRMNDYQKAQDDIKYLEL